MTGLAGSMVSTVSATGAADSPAGGPAAPSTAAPSTAGAEEPAAICARFFHTT